VWPTWEMPAGPIWDFGPFDPDSEALLAFADWMGAADAKLRRFVPGRGVASDVRLWPHHLDVAMLVTVNEDLRDPERSRTVSLGLSPGDAGIAVPYLYVTPSPYPAERPTPTLRSGRWNTEGWYGAVLEAPDVTDQATVDAFLRDAFDLCVSAAARGPEERTA
jgi:hypothetical protein